MSNQAKRAEIARLERAMGLRPLVIFWFIYVYWSRAWGLRKYVFRDNFHCVHVGPFIIAAHAFWWWLSAGLVMYALLLAIHAGL